MASERFGPLVTISATYGTGGFRIARALSERMGYPFVDRMISVQDSDDAAEAAAASPPPSEEHLTEAEEAATPGSRILAYFARAASVGSILGPDPVIDTDELIRQRSEADLKGLARGDSGVLLGRAGAVVLAARPNAFHVRLDGPAERRIIRGEQMEQISAEQARRRQERADRARTLFVKRLYRADPTDAKWYHLMIDPTVFPYDEVVDLLVRAATTYFAHASQSEPSSGGRPVPWPDQLRRGPGPSQGPAANGRTS